MSILFYICILIACSTKQDKLEYRVLSAKMPSLSRVLFCTVPTALALALLSAPITPVAALTSPLPMPLQADYASRMPSTVYATHKLVKKAHLSVAKHNHTLHGHVAPPRNVSGLARPSNPSKLHSRNRRDNSAEFDALLGQFSNGRDNAVSSSQGLRKYSCVLQRGVVFQLSAFIEQLASQSASEGDSPGFQQDAAANFSAFHDTIQQLRALLGNLPADKGLANYDKTSELETILKDFVNANKDALTAVNVMIYNIPGLGPVLGPSE